MITREDVADLRPGDVVEVVQATFPRVTHRGPLRTGSGGELWLADMRVRVPGREGRIAWMLDEDSTLAVVSRAPRPLYVNHPRTEPAAGDVVRQASGPVHSSGHTWHCLGDAGLVLLVDGETGQVVP